jgi:hypothetical protein
LELIANPISIPAALRISGSDAFASLSRLRTFILRGYQLTKEMIREIDLHMSELVKLELDGCSWDTDIGVRDVQRLANASFQKQIRTFIAQGQNGSSHVLLTEGMMVQHILPFEGPELEELKIDNSIPHGCRMNSSDLAWLTPARFPQLRRLFLRATERFTTSALQSFCLGIGSQLRELTLLQPSGSASAGGDMDNSCKNLAACPRLTYLRVFSISDVGLQALGESSSLTAINLQECQVHETGLGLLFDSPLCNKRADGSRQLKRINLSDCAELDAVIQVKYALCHRTTVDEPEGRDGKLQLTALELSRQTAYRALGTKSFDPAGTMSFEQLLRKFMRQSKGAQFTGKS